MKINSVFLFMLWGLQHLLNTPWAYISTSYQSYCNQHGYSLFLGEGGHICTFSNSPLGYFIIAHYNKLVYKPTSGSRLEPNLNPAAQHFTTACPFSGEADTKTDSPSNSSLSVSFLHGGSLHVVLTPQGLRLAFYWDWIGCFWLKMSSWVSIMLWDEYHM